MYDVQHFFAAPIPEEEPISNDFALKVNGQSVPVYTARVSACLLYTSKAHSRNIPRMKATSSSYK